MIKQLLWLFFLVSFFVFYIAYYQSLQNLTTTMVIITGLTAVIFGGWSSAYKYHKQTKTGTGTGEDESRACLRWSPLAELQYDLLGWSAFIAIIALTLVATDELTVTSLAQATVALVTFFIAKKLFIKRF